MEARHRMKAISNFHFIYFYSCFTLIGIAKPVPCTTYCPTVSGEARPFGGGYGKHVECEPVGIWEGAEPQ